MELALCAAATPDDATPTSPVPTRVPPRTTQQRVSPRKNRTPSPMRYAPLFTHVAAPAPVAESTDCWACFDSFVQRFSGTANETPDQSFPFPSKRCPRATLLGRPRKEDAFYVIKSEERRVGKERRSRW